MTIKPAISKYYNPSKQSSVAKTKENPKKSEKNLENEQKSAQNPQKCEENEDFDIKPA